MELEKMSIDRLGDFRDTDYAIQFMLNNLIDFLERGGHLKKKDSDDVYTIAMLKLAANNAEEFRNRAYRFDDVRFWKHEKNKKGKVIKCEAYFTGRWYKGK